MNFHYVTAVLLAATIAMLFSFKTFGKFVFKKDDNRLIFKFLLVTIINYLLNVLVIYIFKENGYNSYMSGAFSAIVVAINSFLLNKFFVFK